MKNNMKNEIILKYPTIVGHTPNILRIQNYSFHLHRYLLDASFTLIFNKFVLHSTKRNTTSTMTEVLHDTTPVSSPRELSEPVTQGPAKHHK